MPEAISSQRERVLSAAADTSGPVLECRLCRAPLRHTFADLGVSPLANSYLTESDLWRMEPFYPLHAYVCHECYLVQLPAVVTPESLFRKYAYFSSFSDSWVEHARRYVEQMVERFDIDSASHVVEVASNDGYLLQFFVERDVEVLGIEPAENVAAAAVERGIPTVQAFFGSMFARELARDGHAADLLLGNNVLAHVPAVHDFVEGLRILLKPGGVITMEFPHLLRLVSEHQFDTIYHEHFSYFSFCAVERLFDDHGLILFDVEELPTHGGSLRVFARHADDSSKPMGSAVGELRERERRAGLMELASYERFGEAVRAAKRNLLEFVLTAKRDGKTIVAYGAAAKGNTLLNYCGIGSDFIDYVVDRSPHKQGRFLPGSRLRILEPERVQETQPDYLLILPWNIKDEIVQQMGHVREFGCRFVIPIPEVQILA
jgi:SAM-dependent methyltransferase